jgi:hypothetical protein
MKHHVSIRNSGICGFLDTEDSRALCSCGWSTGWDNGWRFVTRVRAWWHLRGRSALHEEERDAQ